MNLFVRFFDHQIGYGYAFAANEIETNQSQIVAELTPLADQGAGALKTVVNNVLGKAGATGYAMAQVLDHAIDTLDANELALLKSNVPGFVAAAVAKLRAHATEMLAA